MKRTRVADCKIVNLPRVTDPRGNLSFIEAGRHIPFEIKRVYYVYDVPGGESRGGHAHRKLEQLIIAMSGSFEVILDDAEERRTVRLDRSYRGLYLASMIWREIVNFSTGSICAVLASEYFDESDYFREYDDFVAAKRGKA
ncbi:MAG TPA: FdtA/QdtA family cupin domain-containing protein [Actinomycetota bacterium]|jgi:hypothetical protein|nr:FdtA/QdtA family cupin domain-containing protein [Actinomycetota bacterium]